MQQVAKLGQLGVFHRGRTLQTIFRRRKDTYARSCTEQSENIELRTFMLPEIVRKKTLQSSGY